MTKRHDIRYGRARIKLVLAIPFILVAFSESSYSQVALKPVSVTAPRVSDIGIAQSAVDSTDLRENIAFSLADVLGFGSSAFVKNYGRATLSTVSLRGASATHTGVTWNGMRISSPMLGTTDFSMIPSYFVDDARILHGSSSISETGGGLGGLVRLSTDSKTIDDGFTGQYTQGVGSWMTFDEFLKLGYGRGRWRASARVAYSSSKNDFSFINHDKKENVYDENHNIISSYHPREKNRSGAFKDFNGLASVSYDSPNAGRWSADVWYLSSNRQLPVLTTDYSNSFDFDNRQREQTVRAVASWNKPYERHSLSARAGYIHSWIAYDYWRQIGQDVISVMTRARTHVNTFYGAFSWKFFPSSKWFFSATGDIHRHSVSSYDYAQMTEPAPGYSHSRAELSMAATAKWRPSQRWGIGATLRQEIYGSKVAAPIPALFADGVLWPKIALKARGSVARNYRYPTLNDLYTVPGGNTELRPEHGFSYDAGLSSAVSFRNGNITLSAAWFDSRINDWIMWLPSPKGFYVPRNAKRVHASGVEAEAGAEAVVNNEWRFSGAINYSYTSSVNLSEPLSEADQSHGKQLPYIPRHSGSASLRVEWKKWGVAYRLQAYSERFTMSSNESTLTGKLPPYSVSNLYVDRKFSTKNLTWMAKLAINNLFNADYQTVLSRPMPGINFEFFISLSW